MFGGCDGSGGGQCNSFFSCMCVECVCVCVFFLLVIFFLRFALCFSGVLFDVSPCLPAFTGVVADSAIVHTQSARFLLGFIVCIWCILCRLPTAGWPGASLWRVGPS